MNSTSDTTDQMNYIRSLATQMHQRADDHSFGKVLAKQILNDLRGYTPFGQAMKWQDWTLTSQQASAVIDLLKRNTADELIERIAEDQTQLARFGAHVNKFWNWMLSADGIVGMDEQEAIAKAQTAFGWR